MKGLEELSEEAEQHSERDEQLRKRSLTAVKATARSKQTARIDKADIGQRQQNFYTAIRLAHMIGISHREIAEAAGISDVRVSQIVTGRKGRDGQK